MKISGVFLSSLIGAGFCSGSEILFYFSSFGISGLWGAMISSALFCVFIFIILKTANIGRAYGTEDYFSYILPFPLSHIYAASAYIFTLIIFCAMISGFSEALYIFWGTEKKYGAVLIIFLSLLIVIRGKVFFAASEGIFSLVMITGLIFSSIYVIFRREIPAANIMSSWQMSAISYPSYNFLTGAAVLCAFSNDTSARSARIAAVICGGVIFMLICPLWYLLSVYDGMIPLGNIPLLTIFMRHNRSVCFVYFISLLTAMLSTSSSCAFLLYDMAKKHIKASFFFPLIASAGFFISSFDFSFFVDKLYRAAGILSVGLLLAAALKYIKQLF